MDHDRPHSGAPPELAIWIDQERHARIIVTLAGEMVWASAAARQLLDEGQPFRIDGGRLAGARPAISERLEQLLSSVGERVRCCILDDNEEIGLVWAQRIRAQGRTCIGLTIRQQGEPMAFNALAEARHLTPAEARIVSMMLTGVETARIAELLAISVETLRTHVKHAYRKLGVTSRGELFVEALPFLEP